LFRQYEAVDVRTHELMSPVVEEILMELEIHSQIEEEIFYPALLKAFDEGGQGTIREFQKDHADLGKLIADLRGFDRESSEFAANFEDLIQSVEFHIEKEERDVLHRADEVLGEQLVGLAQDMANRKIVLMMDSKYRIARQRPAQYPHGGEQMRKGA
jgi:hypothetical protein